jgi:chemotaxis protein MotB
MAEEDGKSPIIIKRIKKGGAAAHGGAWKVAYADFVTAMMAFFLLLWLLNSVTEEQLQGISNYFAPTAVSQSPSGAGGMLGGQVIGEGASQSNAGQPTATINLPPSTIGSGGQDFTDPQEGMSDKNEDGAGDSDADGKKAQEAAEKAELKETEQALQQAMSSLPDMEKLKTSLLVDNTPEGMRIQIVDQDGLPMFAPGSSAMYEHTRKLLALVGRVIKQLPQKIAISGHTDGGGFTDPSGYGNWELSADRALASRRILLQSGVPDSRIARVSGRAAADPLLIDDPDSPRNRRVSIILLREPETDATGAPRPLEPPPIPSVIRGE